MNGLTPWSVRKRQKYSMREAQPVAWTWVVAAPLPAPQAVASAAPAAPSPPVLSARWWRLVQRGWRRGRAQTRGCSIWLPCASRYIASGRYARALAMSRLFWDESSWGGRRSLLTHPAPAWRPSYKSSFPQHVPHLPQRVDVLGWVCEAGAARLDGDVGGADLLPTVEV